MTRRNIELLLLCIAVPVVILLFAMMAITQGHALGLNSLTVPIGIFAAFLIAHFSVRKLAPGADPAILPIAFMLSSIGIAFITRLTAGDEGRELFGITLNTASIQVVWLFLGVICMLLVLVLTRNLDRLASYKYTLMLAGVLLLLSPMLPVIGHEAYGSRIWLSLGGLSFQPGEIAKILIVLFLAGYLAQNREMLSVFTWQVGPLRLPDIRTLLPLLIMWGLAFLIVVLEKDLGSALVLFSIFLVMLFVASGKRLYVIIGVVLAAVAAMFLYTLFGHVQVRVATWLDPFADAQNTGYQLTQAIYSMADGGLFGVGIGRGFASQIPVVESDFIFAAIAEEMGLLGAAGVLLLFLCFAIRGLLTAARAKSDVSSFIAVGLTASIILQAFIVVGGVTKLIPLTGLTLPFISQGGSSLLASFIAVGLLLRAGDEGTGVDTEMTGTTKFSANSVLGRVALGKRLTGTMVVFSLLFAVLVANQTLLMVVQAEAYQNMPGNNHTLLRESETERGTISTYDGVVLAQSYKADDGTYAREYPAGDLASHVVGYASTKYGTTGIEAACNDVLKGKQSFATWTDAIAALSGKNVPGNNVTLTLNSKIQKAAQSALLGETGAVVVMDPQTGAVLGMASTPTYDAAEYEATLKNTNDKNGTMINRATQTLYAPGSTFKIVSLTTALESGTATEKTIFKAPSTLKIEGAKVTNAGMSDWGEITLARATEVSSNTAYAKLGLEMGAETLVSGASKFGFGTEQDFELPLATSVMPEPSEMTKWETGWAAAGMPVGEHKSPAGPQATVLQMCMVACGIANDGTIQKPYLVESISNADGAISYTAEPKALYQATSPEIAKRVEKVMKGVVENGTGYSAQISGINVAGKTGTVDKGGDTENSWFIGYAPTKNPRVAVAIVIEDGYEGIACERAGELMRKVLEIQGQL